MDTTTMNTMITNSVAADAMPRLEMQRVLNKPNGHGYIRYGYYGYRRIFMNTTTAGSAIARVTTATSTDYDYIYYYCSAFVCLRVHWLWKQSLLM